MTGAPSPPQPVKQPSRRIWVATVAASLLVLVAVIAVSTVISDRTQSKRAAEQFRAACNSDARSVEIAADAFHADHDPTWPADVATLTRPTGKLAVVYLRTVPVSPDYTITLGAAGAVLVNGSNYDAGINSGNNPCNAIR